MVALRVLLAVLVGVAAFLAAVPALVLVDLTAGGTGLGLCPGGLAACEVGYFVGPELLAWLVVALFVVGAGIVATLRAMGSLERRRRVNGPR
ncbi:MAG TPA: hypothetical protein ENK55_07600 [Actinobacteria bacterium]|nr:hypothetical protein [Actinomycetota bacterium]